MWRESKRGRVNRKENGGGGKRGGCKQGEKRGGCKQGGVNGVYKPKIIKIEK